MRSHVGLNRQRPPVMAFAGLSGHGKTELSQALGVYSLACRVINCARITTIFGLFGSNSEFSGHDNSSSLNNFLADNHLRRAVVVLDEFDKTKEEVRNALLVPREKGKLELWHIPAMHKLRCYRFLSR